MKVNLCPIHVLDLYVNDALFMRSNTRVGPTSIDYWIESELHRYPVRVGSQFIEMCDTRSNRIGFVSTLLA